MTTRFPLKLPSLAGFEPFGNCELICDPQHRVGSGGFDEPSRDNQTGDQEDGPNPEEMQEAASSFWQGQK